MPFCKSQYVILAEHCSHECIYLAAEIIVLVTDVYMFNAAVGDKIHNLYHLCAVNLHRMWSKIYYSRLKCDIVVKMIVVYNAFLMLKKKY